MTMGAAGGPEFEQQANGAAITNAAHRQRGGVTQYRRRSPAQGANNSARPQSQGKQANSRGKQPAEPNATAKSEASSGGPEELC